MKTLIQYGADINARDINGETLLHLASRYTEQEIVEFLLKLNQISVNATNNNQATPLMFACSDGGRLDNMKTLIQYGADINARCINGVTLLHYASRYSKQEIVEFLLNSNQISVNTTNNDQRTPLMFACFDGGHLDNMKTLIQYGADINATDINGSTLLHFASRYAEQEIVELLLKSNQISVNATNNNRRTPLMLACLNGGRLDNMKTLIQYGADINARDIDGKTLLYYASRYSKQEILEFLLISNQISVNATNNNQITLLMFACFNGGRLDNMKTLIRYGADINAKFNDGSTLLHLASTCSKQEIIEFLLKLNQISVNTTNNDQETPLMLVCLNGGRLDNMKTLIQYGADINARDINGSTLLHFASRYAEQEIVEFLLKLNQISVNACNNNQATRLMFACSDGGRLDNMKTLIQYGADINARCINGVTLLHLASRYSKQEVVEFLLNSNQISVNTTNNDQRTPLMFACFDGGHLDNMKTLIQYGADINATDINGSTLLHFASRYAEQEIVELLLKSNQISVNATNNNRRTPLMLACLNGGRLDYMKTLIQYGADINARDIDGKTLLYYASRYSKQEILEFLLISNQISVNATNNNQITLLMFACFNGGRLDNMKTLIEYGADINAKFNDGSTLLQLASLCSKQETVEFLLNSNQVSVNATKNIQAIPLMFACFKGGRLDNLKTLIQYGADINARDIDGSTLLHYASRYSKQEIVEFLLKLNQISVNACNNNQATRLMFACSDGGRLDNMKTLIQYGADINARCINGVTLLHLASRYSKQEVVEFLLNSNQISVNTTNNDQRTPLMLACFDGGHLDNMKTLIQYGADINARDINGSTLLHFASRYAVQEIVEFLLKSNPISVNANNNTQATPLMFACMDGGRLDNMKTLIQYGADINARDINGETLLHLACRYAEQEIVEFLLKSNQISVNATNNTQATPLMFACFNGGRLDNMKTLIQYGADISARDINGETLLHLASRYAEQKIIEFLLKLNQISVNAANNIQATPLMFACSDGGRLDNMNTLIQYGADINAKGINGSTLLHYASRHSKQEIVEFLLKSNQVSVNATNNDQVTPLMLCFDGGRLDYMKTLIQYGADINARDINGETLLHIASRYAEQEIVELMLKLNQISVNATNNNQTTPLMIACLGVGRLDNMKTLIQYGADINARDIDGSTLLHFASRYSNQEIVEFLLKLNQISVNATNNDHATPLMLACTDGGRLDNIKTLIQYGADINARDINDKTLLHYASRYLKQELVEFLLKSNQISVNTTCNDQAFPLMFACFDEGHLDHMKTLIQYGAGINARDIDGSTLLHFASRYAEQEIVEFLLKSNQISVNATNNTQATPLMFACLDGGRPDNMKTLIQYGADISARDINAETLLHFGSRYSKQEIVEFLLNSNQISVNATNKDQATPLIFACWDGGRLDNMKTLIQYGADINARDIDGKTLLHLASGHSKQEIVEFLLKLNQISVNTTNNDQETLLMLACFDGGRLDNMKTLIQYGADIIAKFNDGSTLLHLASTCSKQEIVEFLLKLNQISVNATNNNQATPLMLACLDGGRLDNMNTLIQYGADINARDINGSTLLHFASRDAEQEIVEFLLKLNQISVNATNSTQATPLMFACSDGGRLDNIKTLIQYGADINARGINGSTLLHYAFRYSKQEIVEFLLKSNQVSVNATNNDQVTPLMLACSDGGRLDNMKTLIQYGADINARDINGETLLHIASRYAEQEIVELMLKLNQISVNATNNN